MFAGTAVAGREHEKGLEVGVGPGAQQRECTQCARQRSHAGEVMSSTLYAFYHNEND